MTTNYSPEFIEFWQTYPRRKGASGKFAAFKSFQRVTKKLDAKKLKVLTAKFKEDFSSKEGTEFIPMASTWLNQSRFEDYMDESADKTSQSTWQKPSDPRRLALLKVLGESIYRAWFDNAKIEGKILRVSSTFKAAYLRDKYVNELHAAGFEKIVGPEVQVASI